MSRPTDSAPARRVRDLGARLRVGAPLVGLFVFLALAGPWLAPADPQAIDLADQYALPSAAHLLGTGDNGIDLASVLLHGARLAGLVALVVVGVSASVGTLLGAWAGYAGGAVDHAVSGLADLLQAFPGIVLNIAILAVVDEPGVSHVILALCVPGWVLYARIARAEAMALRQREFVEAALALGMTRSRVLGRHVLPNLLGPIVVQATSGVGGVVLAESTLSFLGLGPSEGVSWGALLDQGSGVLLRYPHVALVAGGAIAATVLGFNLAGDGLRDRLDPRSAGRAPRKA
ncbi:MAG TPA: ABC transporter permease [Polyangiaceae bacterium LLY-WYZ-15_(1-7)]|nr:ABC transporter permease [Polyangiaceae bacterium LLY-WYZ-15_(1-7)]HJL06565.1 ABC transporter permease [Polyangiaceae bacterium LLY-WYZ-15_(1-7)]HJL13779.1 ABC transporter permease [Polyangiaceae bacterium LLY-WYZ-15_(1-7)]HJL26830.1 ABC transporter permease [Polyangiaceae bacterium LLY-WYZ-15_(1-7)]HJL31951.1 ABC transporter permease [Polyangiaceae bacterium LLY-WYZ-15_(1-7)]